MTTREHSPNQAVAFDPSRNVAGAGQHHVGLAGGVAGPFPDAQPADGVRDGLVHVQIGQRRLLAGDDDVEVVATAQAVTAAGRYKVLATNGLWSLVLTVLSRDRRIRRHFPTRRQ